MSTPVSRPGRDLHHHDEKGSMIYNRTIARQRRPTLSPTKQSHPRPECE